MKNRMEKRRKKYNNIIKYNKIRLEKGDIQERIERFI
jgi:hypothetical protein